MATKLVEFKLENGTTILIETIEIDSKETSRTTAVGRKDDILKKVSEGAEETFDVVLESIVPISNILIDKISKIDKKPSKASVEFAIKFTIQGDIIIASLGGESNFKITLDWEKTS